MPNRLIPAPIDQSIHAGIHGSARADNDASPSPKPAAPPTPTLLLARSSAFGPRSDQAQARSHRNAPPATPSLPQTPLFNAQSHTQRMKQLSTQPTSTPMVFFFFLGGVRSTYPCVYHASHPISPPSQMPTDPGSKSSGPYGGKPSPDQYGVVPPRTHTVPPQGQCLPFNQWYPRWWLKCRGRSPFGGHGWPP